MVVKIGPYGKYLECVNCQNRKRIVKTTGVKCPKCGGEIVQRKSKYGKMLKEYVKKRKSEEIKN